MAIIPKAAITQRDFVGAREAKKMTMALLDKGDVSGQVFLGTILGRVNGHSRKESAFANPVTGERLFNVVLEGIFRMEVVFGGKGAAPGDQVESTAAFIPGPFPVLTAAELDNQKTTDKNAELSFALEVYLTPRGSEGDYAYVVKSLLARKADPFADLIAAASSAGIARLPAPRGDAQTLSIGGKVVASDEAIPQIADASAETVAAASPENVAAELAEADAEAHKGAKPAKGHKG